MPSSNQLLSRLSRLRVPVGFAFGAIVWWLATPTAATLAAGVPVALVGEAIRIWAAGHLNKSREVTVSGPYRWVAHPLYAGSAVIAIGLAIACASLVAAGLIAVYVGVMIGAAVRHEEAFLRQKFGTRYVEDRRLEPGERERRFSFALAMRNREYRAVVGLVLAVLLLAWKATYNEPFWRTAGAKTMRPGRLAVRRVFGSAAGG